MGPFPENRRDERRGCPHGAGTRMTHSGACGLRARLKPERSWFDSRGWDDSLLSVVESSWVGSKCWPLHRFLKPRDVGSIPTRPTMRLPTRKALADRAW